MHELFLALFLIFVSARFFGEVFVRLGLPAVIGELFAGIILGPGILGVVHPNEALRLLAEIGILLLREKCQNAPVLFTFGSPNSKN